MNKYLLRISTQDQFLFAKRLGMLVKAGVPILQCLHMLQNQTPSKATKHILGQVIGDVENGQYLSTGMNKFRSVFGTFAINIIEIGEISGTLQENLQYLAEELKKKQALRRKVVGALVYPAFITLASIGVAIMLTVYVFPKILPIFKGFKAQLPWTTRLLILFSDIFLRHWVWILGGGIFALAATLLLMQIHSIKFRMHSIFLKLPVLGNMLRGYYVANMCRTLGLLLKSDVRIVKAVHITADTTANLVYKQQLNIIAEAVSKGEKVSTYMTKNIALFPSILSQMISVGETTGNLSGTLVFLAELYESEVDEMTKNMSTILEPALMVFMGLVVGFIAISIITPIYGITQNLHP